MGQRLFKLTEQTGFGNSSLIRFLEQHGASIDSKAILVDVTPKAIRAAIKNAKTLGLTEEDIRVLKEEVEDPDVYDIW
jgi:methylase of polypeptide subunit release factors